MYRTFDARYRYLALLIALSTCCLATVSAQADDRPYPTEEVALRGGVFAIDPETRRVSPLGEPGRDVWRRVDSLEVKVFAPDRAFVDVFVNGHFKVQLDALPGERTFVVAINEWISAVEFRHRAGAPLHIRGIFATCARDGAVFAPKWQVPAPVSDFTYYSPYGPPTEPNEEARVVESIIVTTKQLAKHVSWKQAWTFLDPILQVGADALSKARTRPHSMDTRLALFTLRLQIEWCREPYVASLLTVEAAGELPQRLLDYAQKLKEWD